MFDIAVVFLVLTAVMAYINKRFVGLPTTIGVMVIALVLSLILVGLEKLGITALHDYEKNLLAEVDFSEVLMQGMLSLLLFAGALHVDLNDLKAFKWQVGLLAFFGTLISTVVVGTLMWLVLPWFGLPLSFLYCLIFGALISPTDPIAVMGILKSANAPRSVETVIAGESLFNDGVGVVLFVLLTSALASNHMPSVGEGMLLFAEEAGGGVLFGLLLGAVVFYMLKSIDSYQEEVLITLAAVLGGYALASHLHVSGPLAMVVAGLMIGNHGRALAMSDQTRHHVDLFWELLDEILNAVLFVLIGLELILIAFSVNIMLASLLAIVITLFARLLTVGLPTGLFHRQFKVPPQAWQVLTWGGLRGGISVALALSLPAGPERQLILAFTYAIVVFSILVQGLSIGKVAKRAC